FYFFQNMLHIEIKYIALKDLIHIPIVIIITQLVHYIIVKSDPLQRSPSSKKAIRFFQNEFPSNYIYDRCRRCIENEKTCINYIKDGTCDHIRYWFDNIFHGPIKKENPKIVRNTFAKGYNCKLIYTLLWTIKLFILVALGTILFHHVGLLIFRELIFDVTPHQILYVLIGLGVTFLTNYLNKADDKTPSGCWQAWREINCRHRSWLESNEKFLVKLICRNKGGTKKFRQK
ncbi:hypothetical protein KA005_16530, partial [bacterium]|nr:hypothetical protein [bacterium]